MKYSNKFYRHFPAMLTFLFCYFMLPAQQKKVDVVIKTKYGKIKIHLFEDTPLHRENFLKLAEEKYYDGTLFHRVIPNFMIQGGDPDSRNAGAEKVLGNGGPEYTLPAEIRKEHIHTKGVLAAARLGDRENPQRASSGSQFYLVQGNSLTRGQLHQMEERISTTLGSPFNYTEAQLRAYEEKGGTPWLDGQYTIFGEVVKGIEVIEKIATVKTGPGDRPREDIKMKIKARTKP